VLQFFFLQVCGVRGTEFGFRVRRTVATPGLCQICGVLHTIRLRLDFVIYGDSFRRTIVAEILIVAMSQGAESGSAAAPSRAPKSTGSSKASHPTYVAMVEEALTSLKVGSLSLS